MNRRLSSVKSFVVAAALMAGISGLAHADDSSLNPFIGDSYAYFNGGNLPKVGNPLYDKSRSSWRQSNPGGLSERQLQALSLSSASETYQTNAPVYDNSRSIWRQRHPNGLSEHQLQALSSSSEATAWQLADQSATSVFASTAFPAVAISVVK